MFCAKAVKVCCGPRCGSHPGHRAIYDSLERALQDLAPDLPVAPTMCRSHCGDGVTVVAPGGALWKARDPEEAHALAQKLTKTTE